MTHDSLNRAYDHARERYAEHGVDAEAALAALGEGRHLAALLAGR